MESFIEGVRLHPCLWNPSHPDYREMHVKDNAWRRVVDHYNNESIPNIQVAKIEWKKLRDNHRDALKRAKLGKNKLLPAQITTWKYAKAMQFLEPHMKYRITENIEIDSIAPDFASKKSERNYFITDCVEDDKPTSSNKRRCVGNTNEDQPDTDALESFFNCILKSTKMMPPWMQTQVKKKIFAIIIESEEMLSNQFYNNTNNGNDNVTSEQPESIDIEPKIKIEVFSEDRDNDV
ncbi:uncharacterized protein [Battus philenor]|uniref:uncharacterized protein n=1 Tax=Battus philenor TaxID=42288 RepID=UPI0035D0A669